MGKYKALERHHCSRNTQLDDVIITYKNARVSSLGPPASIVVIKQLNKRTRIDDSYTHL